jgi:RNA polymerase sigma-70 factor (ECF subfamily)
VVQELFTRLWEKREDRFISVPPKAYLTRATVNAALDYLEKHKNEIHQDNEELSAHHLSVNQTEEQLAAREAQRHIANALEKLPPACKAVFVLSREEEMSYKEIAAAMEISVKTVENQMGKALRILREELSPFFGNLIKTLALLFTFSEIIF